MPIRDKIRPVIFDIVRELAEHGHEAYIVGGAVRDLLLDITPKDYDLATSASPEEVRTVFGRKRSRIIGRRFRLVHVYAQDDIFEVSTFRRQPTSDERREYMNDDGVMIWRDNEYGTLEQDARRRDFTVNALYYDPIGDKGIIDYVGGVADLQNRIVRTIGDAAERMEEDPVRILRALKLVGQYGFTLEDRLGEVVRSRHETIQYASKARLFEELLKVLASPRCYSILEAFFQHGLLDSFLPRMGAFWRGTHGELMRQMLALRGERISTGGYSTSKALALATTCFAAVREVFASENSEDPEVSGGLWNHYLGMERDCRECVQDFFAPLPVPRFFSSRVRDILLLVPRLSTSLRPSKTCRHPEYKYGRELYSLYGTAIGLDENFLMPWPEAESPAATAEWHRGESPRGRGRRDSRRRTRKA